MTPHNRALLSDLLDPASTRCTDEVRGLLAEMADELARLQEFQDKSLKTADGVPMYDGMPLWLKLEWSLAPVQSPASFFPTYGNTSYPAVKCYSTQHAAAIAAQKETK